MIKKLTTTISVGAEKPFSLLHMSDTHLTLADERDDERKRTLAANRSGLFLEALETLAAGEKLAQEKQLTIVHSGDLIDFVSSANLDEARRFTEENDCFFAAGNHEFSLYVGETFEDAAYRNQSLERVQGSFKNDIRFSSRMINGVNLVAIDNSYYLFDEQQLEGLKQEVAKGYPILLLMHTPLYSEKLYEFSVERESDHVAYLMNVPREKMAHYSEYRVRQQLADEVTRQAYEYIIGTPQIKAIITGHIHGDFEDWLTPSLPQYMTDCATLRELRIV